MSTRCTRLAAAMPEGFEAALISTEANRFYFLDFDAGDAGALLIFPDESVYLIDSRYIEIAEKTVTCAKVVEEHRRLVQIPALLKERGVKKLYAEDGVSVAEAERLKAALPDVEVDFSSTLTDAIHELRVIKDEEELTRMKKAQKVTDDCFDYICSRIRPGMREIDMTLEMETYMRSHGASNIAFPTIFISGAKTSMPHGVPGEKVIENGDFVTMDFGAKWQNYCTDMTRTVVVGGLTDEMEKVYRTVLQAQKTCCGQIRAGMRCCDVDKIARDLIDAAGYGKYFGHGLGHSVGIEIHEAPQCNPSCTAVLRDGMTMTIEPGIYLPGRFGVRIEDTVIVREGGCEILGKSPKNLIVL